MEKLQRGWKVDVILVVVVVAVAVGTLVNGGVTPPFPFIGCSHLEPVK